jgi:hypothetical protein
MSKTTKQSQQKIITVTEAKSVSASENSKQFVLSNERGRIAYLEAAIRLIALTSQVGAEKAADMVRKDGSPESDIKNARQLVRVYETLVEKGHVTEAWFAEIRYMDAVAINRALAVKPAKELAYVWKRSLKSAVVECEVIAETNMTQTERTEKELAEEKAKQQAEKAAAEAAKKAAETPAPAPAPETTAPAVETPAPATAPTESATTETPAATAPAAALSVAPEASKTATPPPVSPMAEFETTAEKMEKLAVGIVGKFGDDVTIETIQKRLVGLNRAVSLAIEAKQKAKAKKSA